jgi:hypothetical protein
MARTGLRMMPTSPWSPLKFRTVGFPQYGFKAGMSDGPSCQPRVRRGLQFAIRPSCTPLPVTPSPRSKSRSAVRWCTTVQAAWPLYPRGPRSGPGYSVPVHHRLSDPIRPARRHIPISPQSGLYAMPSLCARCGRLGDQRVVPCFRGLLCIGMSSPGTPRSLSAACTQFLHRRRWPSTRSKGLGASHTPHSDSHGGQHFGASLPFTFVTTCRLARLAVGADRSFLLAIRGFYARAFNGLIALSVAGYNYGGNWASSTGWTPTS